MTDFFILNLWLGPLLVHLKFLNRRRFLLLSLLWFTYDIYFVWLTPLAARIQTNTLLVSSPLTLTTGDHSLGSGDLLWASLFLGIIPDKKRAVLALCLLIVSNLFLGIYSFRMSQPLLFPLLVLWVPLGSLFLISRKTPSVPPQ